MKNTLAISLSLLLFSCFFAQAATPAYNKFDTNHFDTRTNTVVKLKTGGVLPVMDAGNLTNLPVAEGYATLSGSNLFTSNNIFGGTTTFSNTVFMSATFDAYFITTNVGGGVVFVAGKSYRTNLVGDFTVTGFSNQPTTNEWATGFSITNGTGSTVIITLPGDVVDNANGTTPAKVYATNGFNFKFQVVGLLGVYTNLISSH